MEASRSSSSSPAAAREVATTTTVAKEMEIEAASKRMTQTAAREVATLPLGMVVVQAIMVGMVLLSKMALNAGMRPMVLIVYRSIVAAIVVAPLAFVFERVVLAMGLYYYGLQSTSAAYSAIFLNLIPIVTFIIAIILRAEDLALRTWPGRTKVLGAVLCVGGTMVVSLLKGPLLHLWPRTLADAEAPAAAASPGGGSSHSHHGMVTGTLFLCGSCLSYALWLIVQARLAKVFPSKYWMTMLTCVVGSLESLVVGMCISHDHAEWALKWDMQLLTVVYSGVLNTGVTFVLISWAVSRRGPIYPPMFNSLSLIVATILDSVLLGTNIYLGSVLGTLLIVVGLYAFLWGKGKEAKKKKAAAAARQEAHHNHQDQGGVLQLEIV
ncbi:WAT1-related protein At2g37450 [Sorghum bicolor]|uniref:WAT1-related protein At2g37450 n=1 Tax=Sorghum bicolor TaxID=4558 RepID=UPI000B42411A|nr:WAT1-related protein At2g37450 [Sorghum bicolor]|eukprot:XP_021301857.1 WAT1-related protein At2g37450 [Sorghum bicolor]